MRRYWAFRNNLDRKVAGTTFGAGSRVSWRHEKEKKLDRRVHSPERREELDGFTQAKPYPFYRDADRLASRLEKTYNIPKGGDKEPMKDVHATPNVPTKFNEKCF